MRPDHAQHGTTAWWIPESVVAALLGLSLALYLVGVHRHRTRGPWPLHRTAMWIGGLVCLTVSLIGPLAAAARHDFTAHMAGHLLLGMLGPLLLVLAAHQSTVGNPREDSWRRVQLRLVPPQDQLL